MRFVVASLLALAASVSNVAANQHPYTLPNAFPVGPALQPEPATNAANFSVNAVAATPQATPVFTAKLDGVYMNGAKFTFKGANFFGMETNSLVPHGLWGGPQSTTIQKVATFLKANDFNSVRIPFAVDAVLANPPVQTSQIGNEAAILTKFNGKPIPYLDFLDYFIKILGDNKLLVLLDAHVLDHTNGGIGELWYTSDADKNNFENAWKILANRYKDTWNVIGADLKNEPHGRATWGSGDAATDFRLAALKWATSIQQIAPRWLIFVEGIHKSSRDQAAYPAFWGENLMDVQRAQLTLPVADRLVYSPHVYGPDVAYQSYFTHASFPSNMPAIWDLHFGFVANKYGPVVLGEWGGKYRASADKTWQNAFVAYAKSKSFGFFYWCVNPNSGDTEGLLDTDWNTPRADKLAMLSIFKGTPVP